MSKVLGIQEIDYGVINTNMMKILPYVSTRFPRGRSIIIPQAQAYSINENKSLAKEINFTLTFDTTDMKKKVNIYITIDISKFI